MQVENEERTQLPSKPGTSPEQTSAVEETILRLGGHLSTISRNQKYFRTRENRNFSTVRSTEKRIFNFSIIESLMMISMAGLQVFIVRFFFQGARKGIDERMDGSGLGHIDRPCSSPLNPRPLLSPLHSALALASPYSAASMLTMFTRLCITE